VIAEIKQPAKIEHRHRHTIDIGSSKVFLSLAIMAFAILGLSYFVDEQRRTISQATNHFFLKNIFTFWYQFQNSFVSLRSRYPI